MENRRSFLKSAAFGAALPFAAGAGEAKPAPVRRPIVTGERNVFTFISPLVREPVRMFVVGDTHLTLNDARGDAFLKYTRRMGGARGKSDAEVASFRQTLAHAKAEKVDLIALVGDQISFPSPAGVEFLRRELDACGIPWIYTSGNHDWHYEGEEGHDVDQRRVHEREVLAPLYPDGADPLMHTKVVKGIRFVAIDDSTNQVLPEQLDYWRREVATGAPLALLMHIPLYVPGYRVNQADCGHPEWGAKNDPYYLIERRERWPEEGPSAATRAFRDEVFNAPNLLGVFTGHEHRLQFAMTETGAAQLVCESNRSGAQRLDVTFLAAPRPNPPVRVLPPPDYARAASPIPFPEVGAPRALTSGPHDHFLANYFAINCWSPDFRYVLTLETDIRDHLPDGAPCTLGVVDTADGNRFIPVTTTRCWNFQEAAMAHWLPNEKDTFVFNDVRDGRFCAVVMNWKTKRERHFPYPVSAVSEDGTWALSINYSRLFLTRPDYGYAGDGQPAQPGVVFPENDGIFRVDLRTGEAKLLVSCAAVKDQVPAVTGPGGMSYLCHTVISKDMKRIYFLSRSVNESYAGVKKFKGVKWETTAFTANADGTGIRKCEGGDMGRQHSHFNWKPALGERDARTLVVTCKWQKRVYTHVEFTVGEEEKAHQLGGPVMDFDGHCIYSPDGAFVCGDGYWDENFNRHWKMVRLSDGQVKDIGEFFIPKAYRDTYCRCDLHPRWRPDGRQLAFNSVHEGSRQVYVRDVVKR